MDRIAVLVPCYNEAQTIQKVVTDWKTVLPDAVVYVYDNNSTDDTAAIQAAIDAHHASPMMAKLASLREKYDLHMKAERFISDDFGADERFLRK